MLTTLSRRAGARALALAVAASALACAAAPSPAAARISVTSYAQLADGICREAQHDLDAVKPQTSGADLGASLHVLLAVAAPKARLLRGLPLPSTHQATVRQLRRLLTREIALIRQVDDQVTAGTPVQQLLHAYDTRLVPVGRSERRRWRALGARECGRA